MKTHLADIIVKGSEMSSSCVRKGPKSKNRCPCERRKEREDAQRGRPREDRGRDWSYTHKPRNTSSHQKLEEAGQDSPLEVLKECGLTETFISDF